MQLEVKCTEVRIRFISPSQPELLITINHSDTRTKYILVGQSPDRLWLHFCDQNGSVIESENYNYSHVLGFKTKGWVL